MITPARITGLLCLWAACEKNYAPPDIPPSVPVTRPPPQVQVSSGKIHGFYMKSFSGKDIGAFEGIPYAEDPVGKLRLKDPVKRKPWKGTLQANKQIKCLQMDPTRFYRVIGDERCLVLNVYVPENRVDVRTGSNGLLPVIVFIHGGSWHWGSGILFGPSYLLDHNVILVSINYRLGPLGFLTIHDEKRGPIGNFGLKDQTLALSWIVENIEAFGGNPRQITLVGHSAGAASVHYHMLSPSSRGKFQRAVSLSGWSTAFWGTPPNQTLLSTRLIRSVGCQSSSWNTVDCLRRRNGRRIVSKQYDLYEVGENPPILFGPIIEKWNPNGFIVEHPYETYKKGKVANIPWITGITKDEGDIFTLVNYAMPFGIRRLIKNLNISIPVMLGYNRKLSNVTSAIKSFYFGDSNKFSYSGFETRKGFSQMIGDRYFYVPFIDTIKLHKKYLNAPLYTYYFTYKGKHSLVEKFYFLSSEWGVMHMDELQYIFNSTELYPPLSTQNEKDLLMSKYFINFLISFATKGTPKSLDIGFERDEWEEYTDSRRHLLEINYNSRMLTAPYPFRRKFLKSLNELN